MTTYKRRQTDTIEATQFTSELGGIVRGVTAGALPSGLEHSEHSGYSYHGQRVCFGDYLVGSMVVEKAAFEKLWELARSLGIAEAEHAIAHGKDVVLLGAAPSTLIAEAVATRGTTGSVAVDTVLTSKAKPRGKRTEPGA